MRIEKIELIGFKSFADKTSFNFHPGITCIVGPNGCGKSNIVDAFRWVLGEQSAKSLRGEKMEEVIFNGSSTKKPKGMAEVALVVSGIGDPTQNNGDNGDSAQNLTSITRRLYRSGESEYLINKSLCRMKDIKDLFLDTGLEVKSYSILEQDRIAAILNSKAQDRRFLIEEVAGVMKYKVRRTEAQSKLDASRQNLQRINDIVSEVKRQINSLDRQAKKAERYKKLAAEIRAIELKIAKRDYQLLRDSLEKILAEYNSLKENEALRKGELAKIETISEKNRLELLEKEKAMEAIEQEFRDIERSIAETERLIAVAKTDRDNLKEYLTRLSSQKSEFESKNTELSEKLRELIALESTFSSDMTGFEDQLKEQKSFIDTLENELIEKENMVENSRKEMFRFSEELSNLRNDIGKMQTSLEALERKEAALIKDSEESRKSLDKIDESIKEIEVLLRNKNSEILLLTEKKEKFSEELSSARQKIEEIRAQMSETKEELASNMSRAESMKELILDAPSRELLSEGSNLHIMSSLPDILSADPEYEKAIENALAEKVNSFVLKSIEDIKVAVSILKTKGTGRMAFMPLNPVQTSSPADIPEGAIGRALDFIKVEQDFSGIAKNLLGNVFITKDLDTAIKISGSGNRSIFVTLDGDIVEPSGAVIGGEGKGVLKRKREIREIEEIIRKKRSAIEKMNGELNRLQQELFEKESWVKNIETSIVNVEKDLSLLKLTSKNYLDEKERIDRKLSYLTIEIDEIIKEKKSINGLINERHAKIDAIESKKSLSETEMSTLIEEINNRKADHEKQRAYITELRLSITAHKEKLEGILKDKNAVSRSIEELMQKNISIDEEIKSIRDRIAQRETETSVNEEKAKAMVLRADELREQISSRRDDIEHENQILLAHDKAIKALRHEMDSLSSRIAELDIQKAEHRLRIENLTENIRQNYGTDIELLTAEPLLPEDENNITELRNKIQELGAVNLGTLEEYEELRSRYEFLSKQQEDLSKSISELEEAISKINSTTKRKLREAFDILKVKFSEVFASLFGGGKAELILTDENNILETGIDIIVQPPGKKLQNITLLSGGEKALTALSLLFASFLIKPTPLCILDEADAPLDESNTLRFGQMIRDLSKDIQFIVITHNRVTMEASDYIYGITMEEPGVSKVISMQLAEA